MATDEVKLSGEVVAGYYYVYDELTKNVGLVKLASDFTEFVGVRKFADGVMVK